MKKFVIYMMSVTLVMTIVIVANGKTVHTEPESKQMAVTNDISGEFILYMTGSGTITIDWGDGTEIKTYSLLPLDDYHWQRGIVQNYAFSHTYSNDSERIVKISGENITHLKLGSRIIGLDVSKNPVLTWLNCGGARQLTKLDVSNNPALEVLLCHNNQLTSLDVSNNPRLISLVCAGNKLTSLDLRNNLMLEILYCGDNELFSLDLDKNAALKVLDCSDNKISKLDLSKNIVLEVLVSKNNQLDSLDMNELFRTLRTNFGEVRSVSVHGNPGTDTCIPTIASNKGWDVKIDTSHEFMTTRQ